MTDSRLYVIERYSGRAGGIERWSSVRVVESLGSAIKLARQHAGEGTPHRIAEFIFNRVAGTYYDFRKK